MYHFQKVPINSCFFLDRLSNNSLNLARSAKGRMCVVWPQAMHMCFGWSASCDGAGEKDTLESMWME